MTSTRTLALLVCTLAVVCATQSTSVLAGCPFDDGSCQEYCNQQGCNLGYCGHFAWIQCICRKCGDEWNWYDKVHYNPDKQVNQTELDSLKLNGSAPLILTNNNAKRNPQAVPATAAVPQQVSSAGAGGQANGQASQPRSAQVAAVGIQQTTVAVPTAKQSEQPKVAATLTTLLIPDLSDGTKLDLNDIPDENSEKFLDYLTKNHEKLVQATSSAQQKQSARSASSSSQEDNNNDNDNSKPSDDGDAETDGDDADAEQQVTTPSTGSDGTDSQAEEAVEIQISSSNNNQAPAQHATTMTTTTNGNKSSRTVSSGELDGEQQAASSGPTMRLLRMAVAGRSPDDIF